MPDPEFNSNSWFKLVLKPQVVTSTFNEQKSKSVNSPYGGFWISGVEKDRFTDTDTGYFGQIVPPPHPLCDYAYISNDANVHSGNAGLGYKVGDKITIPGGVE